MNKVTISVYVIWAVSEIILARIKLVKTKSSENEDRNSLKILWITIILSVLLGVLLGIRGIGFMASKPALISLSGFLLIIIGLVIRWTAIITLKKYFTVNVSILTEHKLVTTGIYRFVRHPAYAGSLLSFLGLGLSFSNWLSTLVIFIPVLIAFIYRIQVEEKVLIQTFRDKYILYSKRVKRLIPKIY